MIKIFKLHQIEPNATPVFPKGYQTVGSISIKSKGNLEEDLNEAKKLTTSNGHPWWTNPTAYIIHTKARSIDVGDVLEEDGTFYQFVGNGFTKITKKQK